MTSATSAALDAGALERRLDRDLAELVGRQVGEGAVEGADRRAGGADDDDVVFHGKLLFGLAGCDAARRPCRHLPHLSIGRDGACQRAAHRQAQKSAAFAPAQEPALRNPVCRAATKRWPAADKPAMLSTGSGQREHMAKSEEPITIKKYANRRLYNTGTSTYVTLEDLATMVKDGEDFVVYDAKTGEDITRSVLTQIIFEQENKEGQNLLPITFLRQLIRFYGDSMQMLVPRYLEFSIESLTSEQDKFREQMAQAFGSAAASARWRSRSAATWRCSSAPSRCSRRSRAAAGQAGGGAEPDKPSRAGGGGDIDDLKRQIDEMQKRIDRMSGGGKE